VLRGALRKATLAFLETLDDYTLADLLVPRAKLGQKLGIAREPGESGDPRQWLSK
jgi:hypothetical protein